MPGQTVVCEKSAVCYAHDSLEGKVGTGGCCQMLKSAASGESIFRW
jgi:uncharacterized protein (AIM24 family)